MRMTRILHGRLSEPTWHRLEPTDIMLYAYKPKHRVTAHRLCDDTDLGTRRGSKDLFSFPETRKFVARNEMPLHFILCYHAHTDTATR